MDAQETPSWGIEKIYVKDLSIEVPHAPEVFLERETPKVDIQLTTEGRPLNDGFFDVLLTVMIAARVEEKTIFLVEVKQGGVFRFNAVPENQMEPLLAVACPNVLFPYLRESVSDAVTRAGFAPVVLQPVNFEQMYLARLQQAEQAAASAPAPAPIQ